MQNQSRREFLKLLNMLAASGLSGIFSASEARHLPAENEIREKYTVLPWKGDDFTLGHKLRDGELPPLPDEAGEKVDFVIVGGGMAGLCCSHYLKGENFILLEQYEETGGTSSGGAYRGMNYSMGAAATGSHDGLFGQLFEELNIKPATISPEQIGWHCDKRWFSGNSGTGDFYKELSRLTQELMSLSRKLETSSAEERKQLAGKLNSKTFDGCLSGYSPGFVGLISNICRSFFCARPEKVTAMAGVWMIKALSSNSYVFEGGNSGIASALKKDAFDRSPERLKRSCFVWLLEQKGDGASVVYSDSYGQMHRIDCRHAVVCTPPLVTMRLVRDLPPRLKESMAKLEYGAILVANLCMHKKVLKYPYQIFADSPYPFGQMILAETPYEALGRYKADMGSVLTVYHPFEHGFKGREKMIEQDRDSLAESMVNQLSGLFEEFEESLEEIVLTRWGHGLIIPGLGLSAAMESMQGLDPPWLTLAHSSSKGGPSFEGAVLAARYAADRCLNIKGKLPFNEKQNGKATPTGI